VSLFSTKYIENFPRNLVEKMPAIPRLSKAGMPSRSDGWGGLFKDESTD
jgi:hypothetical protein